jgi:hypothetical protein
MRAPGGVRRRESRHYAQRLADCDRQPHVEPRVVRENGSAAGHHRRGARAQPLHVLARGLAR